jgi:FkbM family methyltransferase
MVVVTNTETMATTRARIGAGQELIRKLVGCWPFGRGSTRIPALLGSLFSSANALGVIGGVGASEVVFPFQPGDLSQPLYWFLYEKNIRALMRQMLAPGSVFIDIGAHNGWHAAYALALVNSGGVVIACEPHPFHAGRLKELATLNSGKRLDVWDVAIADQRGEVTLLASERAGWDTIHTLEPAFNELFKAPRREILVSALSLDELLAEYSDLNLKKGPPRVVIKIDAEGSELSILRGAAEALRLPSIKALIVECTGGSELMQGRARQCIEILRAAGWETLVIGNRGVRPWSDHASTRQVDVLAVRPESG